MLMISHNGEENCWITQPAIRIICHISQVANYRNLQLCASLLVTWCFREIHSGAIANILSLGFLGYNKTNQVVVT